jgi:C4-dicarboxylate transporter DctM subunit
MSFEMIGTIGVLGMFLFMLLGMPLGIAMAFTGFLGTCALVGIPGGLSIIASAPFQTANSYDFCVLPLFCLMGEFATYSGVTRDSYNTARAWLGHLPGGLAIASIGACAAFAAICGSSVATAATIGKMALPEMKRLGYRDILSTGAVAAGGTLGVLIPPSVIFIVYGIVTEQSIGKLFMAGIIPGIVLTLLFMITVYAWVKIDPTLAPPMEKASWGERFRETLKSIGVIILFCVIMGGIWVGFFTPTEAAAVGSFGCLILVIVKNRFTPQVAYSAFKNTVQTTGMVLVLIIGASVFSYFVALSKLPMTVAGFIQSMGLTHYGVLGVIVVIYIILGALLDELCMLLLTLPVFFPTMRAAGFDPIWFGVIIVLVSEMGMITPPVGINVFVISGVAKDVPMWTIYKGILPFEIGLILTILLITFWPEVATYLPSLMH